MSGFKSALRSRNVRSITSWAINNAPAGVVAAEIESFKFRMNLMSSMMPSIGLMIFLSIWNPIASTAYNEVRCEVERQVDQLLVIKLEILHINHEVVKCRRGAAECRDRLAQSLPAKSALRAPRDIRATSYPSCAVPLTRSAVNFTPRLNVSGDRMCASTLLSERFGVPGRFAQPTFLRTIT